MKTLAIAILIAAVQFTQTTQAQTFSSFINQEELEVEIEDGVINLIWETKREVNTKYFILELSLIHI